MSKVDNMEELVQSDLKRMVELVGVESSRPLHTFINHSLLASKKSSKNKQQQDESTDSVADASIGEQGAIDGATSKDGDSASLEPIEIDESSD
jgi:hypothetical protein